MDTAPAQTSSQIPDQTSDQKPSQAYKKPIYKRLWFWIIVIIAIVGALACIWIISQQQTSDGNGFFSKDGKSFNSRVVKIYTPSSGAAFKYNSPLIFEDHLYLGTSERTGYDNAPVSQIHDNFFYKMDLSLNVIWQYPLQKKMVSGNAAMDTDHNIYFLAETITENPAYNTTAITDEKGKPDKNQQYFSKVELYSLTSDGKLRWNKQVSPEGEYWSRSMNGLAVSIDNIIYFGKEHFFAYSTDGNQVGQYPDNTKKILGYNGAPITDSTGNVYFISPETVELSQDFTPETTKAYKFTPRLASLLWSTTIGNELTSEIDPNIGPRKGLGVESTPALGVGEKSLIGSVGCTISKIDTATGRLIWSTKPEGIIGFINASPAIDGDDNIFVGSKSNQYSKFFGIKSDGTLLWRQDVGSDLYNSPLLGDDNTVYVGSETQKDGKFHAFDRLTGEVKWKIGGDDERKIPDFSFNSGALYKGYVYVGVHSAEEGNGKGEFAPTLYKIKVDADGYLASSPWPRIYGGNSNNGR